LAFDFHKTLSEKIAVLKPSTPATRRAVYEAVRRNLLAHVRAAAPGIPVLTVIAHQRELETAILSIESEARRHDPPAPPPERKPRLKKSQPEPQPQAAPVSAIEQPSEIKPAPLEKVELAPVLPPPPETVAAPVAPEEAPVAAGDEAPSAPVEDVEDKESKPSTPVTAEPTETIAEPGPEPAAITLSDAPITPVEQPAIESVSAPTEPEPVHYALDTQTFDEPVPEQRTGASWKIAIYVTTAAVIGATIVLAVAFTWNAFEVMPLPPPPKPTATVKATVKAVEAPPAAAGLIASAGFSVAAQAPFKQGMGLLAQGDHAKAILAFDDSIRLDPNQPAAYGYRAFAHWNKGAADLAARDYSEAVRLDPKNLGYRLNRAIAFNKIGRHADAVTDLNEVISAEPDNAAALNSRCWARALLDALEEALADCNQAVRLAPKDANALDSRGFVQLKSGRLVRAVADYSSALRIDPKLASSLYGRGVAKIGRGDRGGGMEDVAAAKALNPDIQAEFARYGIR
jgi:Tfp pilus assembly protein PilF